MTLTAKAPTGDQRSTRKLNWAMLQMRGARASLALVHSYTWGHPMLRTAIDALDEAIKSMEQHNIVERLLQERFEAALVGSAHGSGGSLDAALAGRILVEAWVDGDRTASIQRHRDPAGGPRSVYRVVGFNGTVQPETYSRLGTARRALFTTVKATFRNPVQFPCAGDLWSHPELGDYIVGELWLQGGGPVPVAADIILRSHHSNDGERWTGLRSLWLERADLNRWMYSGRLRVTSEPLGSVTHRATNMRLGIFHPDMPGQFRCIPMGEPVPTGWKVAAPPSSALLESVPALWDH